MPDETPISTETFRVKFDFDTSKYDDFKRSMDRDLEVWKQKFAAIFVVSFEDLSRQVTQVMEKIGGLTSSRNAAKADEPSGVDRATAEPDQTLTKLTEIEREVNDLAGTVSRKAQIITPKDASRIVFELGISVSNAVLIVDLTQKLRARGLSIDEAVIEASTIRVRPILMTSLAAALGLLPMALGLGRGSEANEPLARAVIGGIISSTLLGRQVVPALYRALAKEDAPRA